MWRYSRIDELDPTAFVPGTPEITVEAPAGPGVRVGRASGLDDVEPLVRAVAGEATTAVGLLHDTVAADPVVIDVPAGVTLEGPVVVRVTGPADGVATGPHVIVRLGADASASVVQWHQGGGAGLELPLVELQVGPAARLDHLVVQDLSPSTWSLGSTAIDVDRQATVRAAVAAFGGAYARLRTDCRLHGRGGSGELLAAYFGNGEQTLDFRTFQHHVAPDTTSELRFSGALAGASRSVYTGLIKVGKEARGTNAFQTNRNLKLSDRAWAESVPNLEIENNEVRCSHASTVAPIDEEHRFYLESRGVPTPVAERLIVEGFFEDVLVRMASGELLGELRARVAAKLGEVGPLGEDDR